MHVYFLFTMGLFVITGISFTVFNGDLMHPGVLLPLLFLVACVFSYYLYDYWHLYDFLPRTALIITVGVISFISGCLLSKIRLRPRRAPEERRFTRIDIQPLVLFLSVTISLISALLFFLYFKQHATGDSVGELISNYKIYRTDEDTNLPVLQNLMMKATNVIADLSLIVLINNMITKSLKLTDAALVLSPLAYVFICVVGSNRGNLLMMVMSAFVSWYILLCRYRGGHLGLSSHALRQGVKIGSVVLVGFWMLVFVIQNKAGQQHNSNMMQYICAYLSGPLASFDLYLKQGGLPCDWWGQETFVQMNNNLHSLLGISHVSQRFLEFRGGPYSVVNIYTSFRRFYHDFGVSGVITLSLLQGYVSSLFYRYVREKDFGRSIDIALCIYSYFFYTISYTLTDELFYSSNFSISGVLKVTMIVVVYAFFFCGSRQDMASFNGFDRESITEREIA